MPQLSRTRPSKPKRSAKPKRDRGAVIRAWLRGTDVAPRKRPAPRPVLTNAPPIQPEQLMAMVSRLHRLAQEEHVTNIQQRRRVVALRDRAMILIGRAAALRGSDYRKLTRADVRVVRSGLEITLRRARSQGGTTTITLAHVQPVVLCPVDAWQAWASAAPVDPSTPAFPRIGVSGPSNNPVAPMDICLTIKHALHAVGVDPTLYTEESLAVV